MRAPTSSPLVQRGHLGRPYVSAVVHSAAVKARMQLADGEVTSFGVGGRGCRIVGPFFEELRLFPPCWFSLASSSSPLFPRTWGFTLHL